MTEQIAVLTEDSVNVRDSWDLLDTPRTSLSETDDFIIPQQSKVSSYYRREHENNRNQKIQKSNKHVKQREITRYHESDNLKLRSKKLYSADTSYGTKVSYSSSNPFQTGLLIKESLQRSRPVSANSFADTPKVVPKRYRKLGLRSHDDMLQEQYDQLKHLLNDSENMSKEELKRQHIAQTTNMIADYKEMSGGKGTRGIIISRSLPESLRPKSPRSSSTSSLSSSRESHNTYRSYSSSRSPSPGSRRSSKRVSFKASPSNHNERQRDSLSTSRERSKSPQQLKSSCRADKPWYEQLPPEESPKRPPSKESQCSSIESSDNEESDRSAEPANRSIVNIPRNNNINNELTTRLERRKPTSQHHYISGKVRAPQRRKKDITEEVDDTADLQILRIGSEQRIHGGIYEDINGRKYSDNNLKRTANPDIKRWLRQKEREIRELKKKQKQTNQRQQTAKELELKKKEERKTESEKQLRKWQAQKRKQARLLRRQNISKRKFEKQRVSGSENDLSQKLGVKVEPSGQKPTENVKPTAPPRPRPQSAPVSRRKFTKPKVPLEQVIKHNPELQEQLKQLERQKRLKHRQSYDEWLKAKESEKKDAMKVIREQRKKLEKEISEETARVISEASKRRMDNIRYRGSTATQAEKAPKEEASPKTEPPKPAPYRWKEPQESEQASSSNNRTSKPTPRRTTGMPAQRQAKSAKQRNSRIDTEDTIPDTSENPFSDPFKPPKLRRPKSKLEQSGIGGRGFSRFIWELVNEEEDGGNRPEPQGADSPDKPSETRTSPDKDKLKTPLGPKQSKSPTPPTKKEDNSTATTSAEPVIENGKSIFAMTSIE